MLLIRHFLDFLNDYSVFTEQLSKEGFGGMGGGGPSHDVKKKKGKLMAEFGSDKCKHQIPIQSVARPHDIISATGRGPRTLPGQYPIREEEV